MREALKLGLLGVGGWLLYQRFMGTSTLALPSQSGAVPPAASPASPTKALVAAMAAGLKLTGPLTADEWNALYQSVRGTAGPDPLAVWPGRDRGYKITVDEWWDGVSKFGVAGLASRYSRI